MSDPRVLAIMGSGEVAPTMAKVHRALFGRFERSEVPAVIIDTPYGFQENADDLSARTVAFFRDSVGRPFSVVSYRSRDVAPLVEAEALARIGQASYVMAGPGSPSYLLRQWIGGPIPEALASRLMGGGIVTMASAAAVTLGVVSMPVYEIYKVGAAPHWLEGLDLLGRLAGLRAAVVPHYDNAEGGNHDTRFCYVGERRLRILEGLLPDGAFVLGVDGHTCLLLDLEAGTASVAGLGGVTVRSGGRSAVFPSGSELAIEALGAAARRLAEGEAEAAVTGDTEAATASGGADRWGGSARSGGSVASRSGPGGGRAGGPLADEVARLEGTFIAALDSGDVGIAVGALIDLETEVEARIRSGEDSPELDGAEARLRALIVRLGEAAADGLGDPGRAIEPYVATLLALREQARADRDWATADLIRDRLVTNGVEVHDGEAGPTWTLKR